MKFLIIFGLFCVLSVSESCKCLVSDVKHHYCSDDFAIKIQVTTDKQKTTDPHEVWYGFALLEVFKASSSTQSAMLHARIYTSAESASCGRDLQKGQTYIITGHMNDRKPYVHSCGFGKEVNELTAEEKLFFKNEYKTVQC